MSDKAHFIQSLVVRFGHEPLRVSEIIDRGEALWAALSQRGYGDETAKPPAPPPMKIIETQVNPQTPPVKTAGLLSAYVPFKAKSNYQPSLTEQRDEAQKTLSHWERMLRLSPSNKEIMQIVERANEKLDALNQSDSDDF